MRPLLLRITEMWMLYAVDLLTVGSNFSCVFEDFGNVYHFSFPYLFVFSGYSQIPRRRSKLSLHGNNTNNLLILRTEVIQFYRLY